MTSLSPLHTHLQHDDAIYIGRQSFVFFKPIRIGNFILSTWKVQDYRPGSERYGVTLYECGRLVKPESDHRFQGKVFSETQECGLEDVLAVLRFVVDMTGNEIVVLDYC